MWRGAGLPAWSLFAALIASAGLPIYIHAPKFYVDSYGVSLAALGVTLALLRLFDVVQDPVLGWLAEAGSLLGVSLAAVAPVALAGFTATPFALFAALFVALALVATLAMRRNWGKGTPLPPSNPIALFRPALSDPLARRLLLIALLNASPVAVTSTLFLFFVESRLAAPGWEGPLLLLFFLSAAASTPVWSRLAQRHGAKSTLLAAMTLAIAAFLWTALLTTGDTVAFAIICAASGAALGADLTLLPAIFARRLAQIGTGGEAAAFGLWSFVSKLSLALAEAVLLPTLDWARARGMW